MDDKIKQALATARTIALFASYVAAAALLLKVFGVVNISWSEAKLLAITVALLALR